MNTESNTANSEVTDPGSNRAPMSATQPFLWSVRRELWENRSIYFAPLIAGCVIVFGSLITAYRLPRLRANALALEPTRMRAAIEAPYDIAAMMILFTAFIVAVFYCLDALHGERKDRSILFWKSLPVSDFTALLSKAFIPMVILPLFTFGVIIATQFMMLLISTVALIPSGLAGSTWSMLPWFQLSLILLYWIVTMALWNAPVYAWLLLVSGWARRATFLWAVLPWLAIAAIEKIAFNTSYFFQMLGRRIGGSYEEAFVVTKYPEGSHYPIVDRLTLDPLGFLSSPGLWIGLVVAAAFFFAAMRLRRYGGPL